MQEIAIKYITNILLSTQIIYNQLAHIITNALLDEIYLTLEIRIWLNNNFALLVDYK